ncbi:MAG: hypothetical protein AUJ11_00690 [Parcubacteria group bacterium CG1_02_44_65]|nr:MAG: hypothetical protein AUJ11_00690 [Parcubacteria group bacterium CG1_02_44_65]
MENSICPDARKCGSFNSPACTQKMRTDSCSGPVPLRPGSNAIDRLEELLPESKIGDCTIGGEKDVKVYRVNESVWACEDHYFSFVLPRNPIPVKHAASTGRQPASAHSAA